MSKSRADQLKKVRAELQDKFSEACKKLDETIKAEEEEDGASKAIDYSGLRMVREVAEKAGEGRTGTTMGIMAARMLPRRGGPPTE